MATSDVKKLENSIKKVLAVTGATVGIFWLLKKSTQQCSQDGMVIVQKNNGDEYPYVTICGQQGYITEKIYNKLEDYPNGELVTFPDTPDAIVHYNWLRERGCIIVNPDRVRHFKLGQHYTHKQLIEQLMMVS